MRIVNTLHRHLGFILAGAGLLSSSAAACIDLGSEGETKVGGCPDDLQFFEAKVYKPVLEQKCAVCHSASGLAKNSHFVLVPASEVGALEKNFETVKALAATSVEGTSVLLSRPSGRHPEGHTGGKLIPFDGPEYNTLSTFVNRVTKGEECDAEVVACTGAMPGRRALRRLSRSEYDATVQDLLEIPSHWGASFTADTVVEGFDNNAAALRVSPLWADQARRAAEEIAETAMAKPGGVVGCDPAVKGEEACAAEFIASFGERAFRRPLSADDEARYLALYKGVAAEDGFSVGVQTVITAMLQSPHFLYRAELGDAAAVSEGRVKLTPYEIAAELSYFLWGTMPDAELFAAAKAGTLSSEEEIEKQARRMLQDPRSDAVLERFVEQWLELDRLASVPKDSATYPEFDMPLRAAMAGETKRFIRDVVRQGQGTLPELLTAKYSFMTPELAAFYGLPAPSGGVDSAGYGKVDLSGTARAGS